MAQGFESRQGQKIFVLCTMLRPAVGLTDTSSLQWVQQVAVCKEYSSLGMRLPAHLHLVPRLRWSGAIPPTHPCVLWCVLVQLYLMFVVSWMLPFIIFNRRCWCFPCMLDVKLMVFHMNRLELYWCNKPTHLVWVLCVLPGGGNGSWNRWRAVSCCRAESWHTWLWIQHSWWSRISKYALVCPSNCRRWTSCCWWSLECKLYVYVQGLLKLLLMVAWM